MLETSNLHTFIMTETPYDVRFDLRALLEASAVVEPVPWLKTFIEICTYTPEILS